VTRVRRGLQRLSVLLGRAVSEFFADGCPQRAAAIAYFTLFSLFPLAILSVVAVGLVVDDDAARDRVVSLALETIPVAAGRPELEQVLRTVTAQVGGFGLVGLVGLLFAAGGVMGAVRQALNAAWDVEDPRPPLQGKLLDLALVLGVGLLIATSVAMTLALRLIGAFGAELADLGQLGELAAGTLGWLAQLAPAALAFVVFAGLFRVVPAAETRLRDVWPGAVLAAVGFEVAKTAFAFYVANVADYGAVYGPLAAVIAFLLFVFVAANVFLLGAEVASEWPAVRDEAAVRSAGEPLRERLRRALRRLVPRPDRPGHADDEPPA
jgi:membrane protein